MKKLGYAILAVLAAYLIGRAIAEPIVINASDPSSFRNDWGGPTLIGVLAVHCGPGLVAAAWAMTRLRRLLVRGARPRT